MKNGTHFVISVMSRDRAGIVHQVASAINELGGHIADLRQSVLRGYATMILLASFPANVSGSAIRERLSATDAEGAPSLDVAVREAPDATSGEEADTLSDAYVLTASGDDRMGFVATLSSFCVRHGINILDLATSVRDGTYTMILLVDLRQCRDIAEIRRQLSDVGDQTGLSIVLQHYDIFRATSEVGIL